MHISRKLLSVVNKNIFTQEQINIIEDLNEIEKQDIKLYTYRNTYTLKQWLEHSYNYNEITHISDTIYEHKSKEENKIEVHSNDKNIDTKTTNINTMEISNSNEDYEELQKENKKLRDKNKELKEMIEEYEHNITITNNRLTLMKNTNLNTDNKYQQTINDLMTKNNDLERELELVRKKCTKKNKQRRTKKRNNNDTKIDQTPRKQSRATTQDVVAVGNRNVVAVNTSKDSNNDSSKRDVYLTIDAMNSKSRQKPLVIERANDRK